MFRSWVAGIRSRWVLGATGGSGPGLAPRRTDALNITGDANFGTIYQAGGEDGLDKTLDLFFAQPITTTTNTDVLMVEHWWGGVNLNGATVSGIDMSGNLVGSVTVAGFGPGQDMGRSGNRPARYIRLDVDGNPVTANGQSGAIDGPARAWGFNFDAGLQLKGVRLAWNNGGLQYLGEVWGVAVSYATAVVTITQQPANVTAQLGNTATFTVVATVINAPPSSLTYQWRRNNVLISGATKRLLYHAGLGTGRPRCQHLHGGSRRAGGLERL